MAADLGLGIVGDLSEADTSDSVYEEHIQDDSNIAAWIRTEVPRGEDAQVEVMTDPPIFDAPALEEPALDLPRVDDAITDLVPSIDWLNREPLEFKAVANQAMILNLDPSQLDVLFGASESIAVHVVYAANHWQVAQDDVAATSVEQVFSDDTTGTSQMAGHIRLISLVDQSGRIYVDVLPGDVEAGTASQIVIKLVDSNASDTELNEWRDDELDFFRSSSILNSMPPFAHENSSRNSMNEFNEFGPSTALGPVTESDLGTDAPASTTIGDDAGENQPHDGSDGTPLPETRRESLERNARATRRTLDIRSPGSAQVYSLTNVANRAPVTPNSLATQAALASVYDAEAPATTAPGDKARWMIDPKPARMQVASFVLSRTDRLTSSVATKNSQPTTHSEEASSENASTGAAVIQDTSSRTHIKSADATVSAGVTTVTRVAALPSEGEVSAVTPASVNAPKSVKVLENRSPAENNETTLYASVVDRLLGSPISIAAILGMTVVARVSESDESLQ